VPQKGLVVKNATGAHHLQPQQMPTLPLMGIVKPLNPLTTRTLARPPTAASCSPRPAIPWPAENRQRRRLGKPGFFLHAAPTDAILPLTASTAKMTLLQSDAHSRKTATHTHTHTNLQFSTHSLQSASHCYVQHSL
jgi:hypothetical protein